MRSADKDYSMPSVRWALDSYTYGGLCSHFSINEGYSYDKPEEHLTRDDINQLALERKQAKNRQHIANKGEGVHAANTKAYGDKHLVKRTFKCNPCGLTFRSNAKKLEHEARQIHKDKVNGVVKKPKGRKCKSFVCKTCNWVASCSDRLRIHLEGNRHAKKLRDLEILARQNA